MYQIKPYIFLLVISFLVGCSKDEQPCVCGSGVFQSSVDNGIIEGELFLPNETGTHPVMIIVPGSSLESRQTDEPYAELFSSIGFATYIYDKRGIGGSTGSYPPEDTDGTEFLTARADDILAIVTTLKQHQNIDVNNIGLLGASQGTWVSAIVFDESSDINRITLISGGAIPTGWEQYYDNFLLDNPELSVEDGHEELASYKGALGFDSRSIFEKMEIPVLFMLGGQDRSHPTLWELDFVESLNKSNFDIHFYPNSNHDMLDIETGEFHPDMIPRFLSWVEATL